MQVGDEVIAGSTTTARNGGMRKKPVRRSRTNPDRFEVVGHAESGRVIRCTPDHRGRIRVPPGLKLSAA